MRSRGRSKKKNNKSLSVLPSTSEVLVRWLGERGVDIDIGSESKARLVKRAEKEGFFEMALPQTRAKRNI